MPNTPKLTLSSQHIGAGLAAIGVIALALAGFVNITTPGEEECKEELSQERVVLADCQARLELYTEATNSCKEALEAITENP